MSTLKAMKSRVIVVLAFVAMLGFATAPAGAGVTATKGQSAEQQQKDISECQSQATQSSGFNPSAPPPVDSGPNVGGRVKGAAVGGAAGAAAAGVRGGEVYDNASDDARQEYRQNQAEGAAAAGAVVGASRQRQERRADRKEEKAQESKATAYDQAYQGCLGARGYTVTP